MWMSASHGLHLMPSYLRANAGRPGHIIYFPSETQTLFLFRNSNTISLPKLKNYFLSETQTLPPEAFTFKHTQFAQTNELGRALELISHVRGSTRSGASGKRRWDEVVSLLAEASEASVEFDELQQLGIYEVQCLAWRARAESVVAACSWLNVICSSGSDDGDGDEGSESENHEEESGYEDDAIHPSIDSSSPLNESAEESEAGTPCVDVKEIFKSSWWMTDDIQASQFASKVIISFLTECCTANAILPRCSRG